MSVRSRRSRRVRAAGIGALVAATLTAGSGIAAQAYSGQVVTARINARWTPVVDSKGQTWSARSGFIGTMGRSDNLKSKPIAGTTDDVLYQANVWGMTGFRRAVPNGTYQVRLLMAEDYHRAAGKRIFNVFAEGKLVLSRVDIHGAVGARATAYDRTFTAQVGDGSLDLQFAAVVNRPLISAIEIIKQPDGGVVRPTPPTDSPTLFNPRPTRPAPKRDAGPPAPPAPAPTATLLTTEFDVSGGGSRPVQTGGTLRFTAGAGDSRSEVFWGTATDGRYRLQKGSTITTTMQLRHDFTDPVSGAAPDPATWHTVYQLHGPTQANTWPSPPIAIAWQNGTYRVGGGISVPTSTGSMVNRGSWYMPYAPAPQNVWRTLKVETYLDGPGRGWVSIWLDGEPYMQRWKPAAGTMYTDSGSYSHREISVKSGLYTGTKSPTWSRWVEQRSVTISVRSPEGTTSTAVLL